MNELARAPVAEQLAQFERIVLANDAVAARRDAPGGPLTVLAPRGFADLFGLVVRPNRVRAPREVYEEKASRWARQWPALTIVPY